MIESLIESGDIKWKQIEIKRGDYLIQQGQREHYFYFVLKGALRAFAIIGEEEFTIRFAYKNSIVAAIPAYFTGEPSELSIQAIRKSTLLKMSKVEFEAYFKQSEEKLIAYNNLLKELVASFYEREIDLLTQSPAERIERIRKRSPLVFQEIPHKYIASYLRMSPETLSRLLNS